MIQCNIDNSLRAVYSQPGTIIMMPGDFLFARSETNTSVELYNCPQKSCMVSNVIEADL